MATIGLVLLVIAFAASIVAAVALFSAHYLISDSLTKIGRGAVLVDFIALLGCCAVLVVCFMGGDVSILYVLEERSLSTDGLAWLYKLSGLWAGRAGSLLFWTFLISLFDAVILGRLTAELRAGRKASGSAAGKQIGGASANLRKTANIDDLAMAIVSVVIAVFCGVLLFSGSNMPFEPTPAEYFAPDGSLTAAASTYSMNQLLEHWAMAIHPPLLFVGYAGLTVPFAYAMAALVLDDPSKLWVERSTRFVMASWLFLGAGIGLGAVWAYVVLGWGGYWGWDAVENASLLSWLVCVALVHTFTVYRQRGAFKRWAVMCACLAFTFVIVATFITRSGIVQSVHAFAGDPVSLALFGGLIVVSIVVPLVGIIMRWKSFVPDTEGADDVDSLLSKDAAYYFNNVIMIVFALLLTYMTVASALPRLATFYIGSSLVVIPPFAGDSLGVTSYEAIARPLGIVYLLILAVCPLLAWGVTDPRKFLKQARVPAVCAVVLFVLLAVYWANNLLPVYDATMAKGGTPAQTLYEAGPPWYYNGLAIVGLFVASLLFFNALFMFVRNVRAPKRRGAAIGGAFAHTAMAVMLVGLIGSNMYVNEQNGYLAAGDGSSAPTTMSIGEYELSYSSRNAVDSVEESGTILYEVTLDVAKNGERIGSVTPSVQVDANTMQQKLNAAVVSFPEEDLFVVFGGSNVNGDLSIDARINPFISLVWIGFGMLMVGTLFALVMPRSAAKRPKSAMRAEAAGIANDSRREGVDGEMVAESVEVAERPTDGASPEGA